MAIHPHNTPEGVNEPGLPPIGLLRSGGVPCRVLSHGEMLALLAEAGTSPPERLSAPDVPRGSARYRTVTSDVPQREAAGVCSTVAQTSGATAPNFGVCHSTISEDDSADLARALHARRALEQALDHGTALLEALGLPRLVDDGFAPIDPETARAALAEAVALLDEIDLDPDFEPNLGAPENHEPTTVRTGHWQWSQLPPDQRHWAGGEGEDREADVADEPHDDDTDAEETLGWSANVRQVLLGPNTADGDLTAPERHGKGFVRCCGDDFEDGADAEETYEDPWAVVRPVSTIEEAVYA